MDYLPQGCIQDLCANTVRLDAKIREIVFSNQSVIDGGHVGRFAQLEAERSDLSNQIRDANQRLSAIEAETSPERLEDLERRLEIARGAVRDRTAALRALDATDRSSEIARLAESEQELRQRHSGCEELRHNIEALLRSATQFATEASAAIAELSLSLDSMRISSVIPKVDLNALVESLKAIDVVVSRESASVLSELGECVKQRASLRGEESAHAELLRSLQQAKDDVHTLSDQIAEIDRLRADAKRLDADRLMLYSRMLVKYGEWKHHYHDAIDAFSSGKRLMLGGICFQSHVRFDTEGFVSKGAAILDGRRYRESDLYGFAEQIARLAEQSNPDTRALEPVLLPIIRLRDCLKRGLTSAHFHDWLLGDHFALSTRISFREVPLEKLSLGQKGTVLLKIMLSEGDSPLLIDQAEENLDNRFIFDELVPALREAKTRRQIILATNNPNLVVNADAEQVIVAHMDDNWIWYETGSIEKLEMRPQLLPILEGGEEAFRKRRQRWDV